MAVIENWTIQVSKSASLDSIKALERSKQAFATLFDLRGIPVRYVNVSTWHSAFGIHYSKGNTKDQSQKICMNRYNIIGVNNDVSDSVLISVWGYKKL